MRPIIPLLALWTCLAGAPPKTGLDQSPCPSRSTIQNRLDQVTLSPGIPGASLALIRPDGTIHTWVSGWADPDRQTPMRPEHRFLSGSTGKTLIMALVMRAVGSGRLSLDQTLDTCLCAPSLLGKIPCLQTLTLRHLLNHTAGLKEYVESPELWAEIHRNPDRSWTGEERMDFIRRAPVDTTPGWHYADTHYILLGMVLEHLEQIPLEEILSTQLIKPLSLHHTLCASRRDLPDLANGLASLGAPFHWTGFMLDSDGRYRFNPQVEWAGGGLVTTAADLAAWTRALYGRVLSRQDLDMIQKGVVPTGGSFRYGLGTMLWDTPRGRMLGHTGFAPGYNAIMVWEESSQMATALLFNSDHVARETGQDLLSLLLRILEPDSPSG